MIRPVIHIMLHFAVPGFAARIFYKENMLRAWLVMVATMVIDLDHLLADPVYDPARCGVGFHPLHSVSAIVLYSAALFFPKMRLIAIGLLIHIGLDALDCLWMGYGSHGL